MASLCAQAMALDRALSLSLSLSLSLVPNPNASSMYLQCSESSYQKKTLKGKQINGEEVNTHADRKTSIYHFEIQYSVLLNYSCSSCLDCSFEIGY
jgi:hypothetical protein